MSRIIIDLPEPYKTQALNRTDLAEPLRYEVCEAFTWPEPEIDYWWSVAHRDELPEFQCFTEQDEMLLKMWRIATHE